MVPSCSSSFSRLYTSRFSHLRSCLASWEFDFVVADLIAIEAVNGSLFCFYQIDILTSWNSASLFYSPLIIPVLKLAGLWISETKRLYIHSFIDSFIRLCILKIQFKKIPIPPLPFLPSGSHHHIPCIYVSVSILFIYF